jgi:hypothetical protein
MSAAARDRLRRFRARLATGKVMLRVEVNLADHIDLLLACGVLQEWDDGDRSAIAHATERLLAALAAEHETRFQISVGDRA